MGTGRAAASQDRLAELIAEQTGLDLDNSRLSRIESGKEIKFYEAVAILRALHALDPEDRSYDWLIGTEPLPLKKAKGRKSPGGRKSSVVEPIITKRPHRRQRPA